MCPEPRAPEGTFRRLVPMAAMSTPSGHVFRFRELCGTTPASVRLAELVEADVQHARGSTPESAALDALRSIRAQADILDAFIRHSSASN